MYFRTASARRQLKSPRILRHVLRLLAHVACAVSKRLICNMLRGMQWDEQSRRICGRWRFV
jgi:hypothetical protein